MWVAPIPIKGFPSRQYRFLFGVSAAPVRWTSDNDWQKNPLGGSGGGQIQHGARRSVHSQCAEEEESVLPRFGFSLEEISMQRDKILQRDKIPKNSGNPGSSPCGTELRRQVEAPELANEEDWLTSTQHLWHPCGQAAFAMVPMQSYRLIN